jgi:protocatechuate 3,4-dioxygenase beta subunit
MFDLILAGKTVDFQTGWQRLLFIVAFSLPIQPIASFSQEIGGESVAVDDEGSGQLLKTLIRGRVVDEAGEAISGAKVETLSVGDRESVETRTLENGTFLLRLPGEGYYGQSLLITDQAGKRASFISGYEYTTDKRTMFKVVLKPLRTTIVTVTDALDQPLPGASLILQANYQELARAETDPQGQAVLRFPADAKVDWINAFKDGEGYEYFENYDAFPTQERLTVPQELKLQLGGAVSVVVQVTDSVGQPVAGIPVTPWTIQTKGKLSYANVGGVLAQETDEHGLAKFAYIPSNLDRGVTFLIHSSDYFCPNWPHHNPGDAQAMPLQAQVLKLSTVSGNVYYPDGNPAPGIKIQGEGRGATNNYFRDYTTSKSDGTYEFKIYPNQETILAVTSPYYAANVVGIELAEGQKLEDVDLILSEGTRIRGTVTVGDAGQPAVGENATLIQEDGNANLVRWNDTDANGHYEFRVAAGSYSLRVGAETPIKLQVKDEAEMVHDVNLPRLPRGTLSGAVISRSGDQVSDAVIVGESINHLGHAGFKTTAQPDGRFSVERWQDEMQLYAFSPKANLACQRKVSADDATVELKLLPAASIQGKVLDANQQPVFNAIVKLNVQGNLSWKLNREVTTNEAGEFRFQGVLLNASWNVSASLDGKVSKNDTVKTDAAKEYDLEPLVLHPH